MPRKQEKMGRKSKRKQLLSQDLEKTTFEIIGMSSCPNHEKMKFTTKQDKKLSDFYLK